MRGFFVAFLFFGSLMSFGARAPAAEIYGTFPTGLLELEEKHPYYLFVPPGYTPERAWPLLLLLGEKGEDPREVMEPWMDWAKKNEILLLSPPNLVNEEGVPSAVDEWILKIEQEVKERYRVDPAEVWVAGTGLGAHYAAYLGLRYPEKFTAALLVGRAWPGPFEKLAQPTSRRIRKIPFYLAVDAEGEGYAEIEARALELEAKGYPIRFHRLSAGEGLAELQNRMLDWFEERQAFQRRDHEKLRGSWKERFRMFMDDFLEV